MGCDIHAHFEVKVNGEWLHYSAPRIQRHYGLFAKICGVRNDHEERVEPISKPKGLPSDLTKTTKLCSDVLGVDGHSHTWLNAEEIKKMVDFIHDNLEEKWVGEWEHMELGYLFGNGWADWKDYPEDYPSVVEDIRFICWFDN